jgi:hypothetical protein
VPPLQASAFKTALQTQPQSTRPGTTEICV